MECWSTIVLWFLWKSSILSSQISFARKHKNFTPGKSYFFVENASNEKCVYFNNLNTFFGEIVKWNWHKVLCAFCGLLLEMCEQEKKQGRATNFFYIPLLGRDQTVQPMKAFNLCKMSTVIFKISRENYFLDRYLHSFSNLNAWESLLLRPTLEV